MATPLYDFHTGAFFIWVSDAQQDGGETKVDQQGQSVHDGGDEGGGHDGGVEA